jgi:hypothetical protein
MLEQACWRERQGIVEMRKSPLRLLRRGRRQNHWMTSVAWARALAVESADVDVAAAVADVAAEASVAYRHRQVHFLTG